MLTDSVEKTCGRALEAGRAADPVKPSIFVFAYCDADRNRTIDMAVARLSKQYVQDFSKIVGRYVIAGTPEDCRARVQQYIGAGARTVFLSSACASEYLAANEEILANEVAAAFK